jgi:hypothetical protein
MHVTSTSGIEPPVSVGEVALALMNTANAPPDLGVPKASKHRSHLGIDGVEQRRTTFDLPGIRRTTSRYIANHVRAELDLWQLEETKDHARNLVRIAVQMLELYSEITPGHVPLAIGGGLAIDSGPQDSALYRIRGLR